MRSAIGYFVLRVPLPLLVIFALWRGWPLAVARWFFVGYRYVLIVPLYWGSMWVLFRKHGLTIRSVWSSGVFIVSSFLSSF
jgi:hypothetical protein